MGVLLRSGLRERAGARKVDALHIRKVAVEVGRWSNKKVGEDGLGEPVSIGAYIECK